MTVVEVGEEGNRGVNGDHEENSDYAEGVSTHLKGEMSG